MLIANFTDSDSITLKGLTQYDRGQLLEVRGLKLKAATEVHFSMNESDAIIRVGNTINDIMTVDIPNVLLTDSGVLNAYIYVVDGEAGETIKRIRMYVTGRAKPTVDEEMVEPNIFDKTINSINESVGAIKASQDVVERAQTDVSNMHEEVVRLDKNVSINADKAIKVISEREELALSAIKTKETSSIQALDDSLNSSIEKISEKEKSSLSTIDKALSDANVEGFRSDIDNLNLTKADLTFVQKLYSNQPSEKISGIIASVNDTVEQPIKLIEVNGNSIQDGIPTKDAQVEIKSVGDSGSVDLVVCGKNWFDATKYNKLDDTWSKDAYHTKLLQLKPDTIYYMSMRRVDREWIRGDYVIFNIAGIAEGPGAYFQINGTNLNYFYGKGRFKTNSTGKVYLRCYSENSRWFTDIVDNIQIEVGKVATDFEQYKEQRVTIPITSNLAGLTFANDILKKKMDCGEWRKELYIRWLMVLRNM